MKRTLVSIVYTALFLAITHNALAVETAQQKAVREARQKELGHAGWMKPSYLDKWNQVENIPHNKAFRLYTHIFEYWATLYGPEELVRQGYSLPYFRLFQRLHTQIYPNTEVIAPIRGVFAELARLAVDPNGWHAERLREYREYQEEQRRLEENLLAQQQEAQQQEDFPELEAALQASAREYEQKRKEEDELKDVLHVSEISAKREAEERARRELEEDLALIEESEKRQKAAQQSEEETPAAQRQRRLEQEEREWEEQQAREVGAGPSTQQPQHTQEEGDDEGIRAALAASKAEAEERERREQEELEKDLAAIQELQEKEAAEAVTPEARRERAARAAERRWLEQQAREAGAGSSTEE